FLTVSTATDAGNYFAEINAENDSALYQDIYILAGESVNISFLHRGREGSDTAEVFISDPDEWTGTTFLGSKEFSLTVTTNTTGTSTQGGGTIC
ncbi:MAG: hypothetical protein F6K09_31895, partial [Merismopedia sp. SIO2A8]|nr:hypothetical protein [Merismopedia sp. SIO2A8]